MESGECQASVCAGGRDGSLQQGRGLLKTFCVRFISPLLHAMNSLLKGLHYPAVLMDELVSSKNKARFPLLFRKTMRMPLTW